MGTSLGPCKKLGLTVRAGVTLDGGGHTIRGSRTKGSHGVVLDEKSHGAVVKNFVVTGFERGVRLAGVEGGRVEGVESHHNGDPIAHKGYGIDVARGASNNVVENVHVHHNADEGIHIGNDARGNRVRNSRFEDNYRENVYFLENDDNSLEGSTLSGGGASSVFIKHARNVRVEGNTIRGRGIQVRGRSSAVRLIGNQLTQHGVTVQPYEKGPLGKTVPRDVTIEGGTIRTDKPCVRLVEARQVRLVGAGLDCTTSLQINGNSDLVALDTLLRRVECSGPGVAREEANVTVRFLDASGGPVAGVEVSDGAGQARGASGEDGSWTGSIVTGAVRCPGPRQTQVGPVTIKHGSWTRTVPAKEMSGEIRVGDG